MFFNPIERSGIVAPPGAVKRKPTRRALIRRTMSVRRRTQDDLVQSGEQEEVAVGGEPDEDAGTGRDPGLLDLSSLFSLLQKTLQTQEREAFKQEQRWRSVQMQLNNFMMSWGGIGEAVMEMEQPLQR
ncbi:unnamed protein product [Gadus morhua 'NCC']